MSVKLNWHAYNERKVKISINKLYIINYNWIKIIIIIIIITNDDVSIQYGKKRKKKKTCTLFLWVAA